MLRCLHRLGAALCGAVLLFFAQTHAAVSPGEFKLADVDFHPVNDADLPYYGARLKPVETPLVNADGILMVSPNGGGEPVDHPTAQSQYVLYTLLNNYQLTGDDDLLERASRNLDRMIGYGIEHRGGLFFPFYSDFKLHGLESEWRHGPWCSGMTQGVALSAFVRTYRLTRNRAYRQTSERLFRSLRVPFKDERKPSAADVDDEGYLWIEEYPGAKPDRTFNGFIFAMYGVFDYWMLTKSEEAYRMLQGCAATILRYYPEMRRPGLVSNYCLTHRVQSASYHMHHVTQMLWLYTLTRDTRFARMADELWLDYPYPYRVTPIDVVLHAGEQTFHRFPKDGPAAAETRTVTLDQPHYSRSMYVEQKPGFAGRMIRVDEGPFQGWSVEEEFGKSWARGFLPQRLVYKPERKFVMLPGGQEIYLYNFDGRIIEKKRWENDRVLEFSVTQQTLINGRPHVLLTTPGYEERWAVVNDATVLE